MNRLRTWSQAILASSFFSRTVLGVIFLNTLALALEHEGQPAVIGQINTICLPTFSALFALEVAIKLLALGPLTFFLDSFNAFDTFVVIISVLDAASVMPGLSALRGFRLLRVLTALRFLPTMRNQLTIMARTLESAVNLLMLLLLFVFINAILSMHLFGAM